MYLTTDLVTLNLGLDWSRKAKERLTPEYRKKNPEAYKAVRNAIRHYEHSAKVMKSSEREINGISQ